MSPDANTDQRRSQTLTPGAAGADQLLDVSCDGQWTLTRGSGGDGSSYPATVPGCVHTDLLAAGAIPDPWFRDNEKQIHWVCQQDWVYERTLDVPEALLACDSVVLRCEGLDTLARVYINGNQVGATDNMFRTYEFDARPHLKATGNTLRVEFDSPIPLLKRRDAERRLPAWNVYHDDFQSRSYVRKMGCAFGWDWGVMAPTAGIWRSMTLHGRDARIDDFRIRQHHADAAVKLDVTARIGGAAAAARFTLSHDDATVAAVEQACDGDAASARIDVQNPQLWWPNGMGAQPLYQLTVELLDAQGRLLDRQQRQVGLRTIELIREPDAYGESFRFRVNGRDIFATGANCIPCDVFPSRVTDEAYDQLLTSAAEAGMNMLRIWGGGIYEDERFYDLCDQLGLMIWQDFMFACSTYPTFDPAFMETVRAEAVDNVRRLRHRACLALWCGNNELEQGLVDDTWTKSAMSWEDYKPLFDELLPEVVAAEDGVTPYWPSSGHTPGANRRQCNDPNSGDAHAWSVWFGGQPFEAQRQWTFRFMSEFGFQSFPEPRTVEAFTEPEDRSLTSWVMDYHQRSGNGNPKIFRYLLEWFQPPHGLENSLWLTQLTQALCIQYAAEHARRIQGRMDGLLYWQINDLWPGATWSSIDVYGRWKALHYFAKRFFAPVLVSVVEDRTDSSMTLHVSNHGPEPVQAEVQWRVATCAGETQATGSKTVEVPSQANVEVDKVDCHALRVAGGAATLPSGGGERPPMEGDRDLLFWTEVLVDGKAVSRNLAAFAKPKHWQLQTPTFTTSVEALDDGRYRVEVGSDVAAPWTRLEIEGVDARWSDNFIHLDPAMPGSVTVTPSESLSLEEVTSRLRVQPVVGLWSAGDGQR